MSKWNKENIKTYYSSSYYDNGILDYYDHLLEVTYLKKYLESGMKCLDLAAGNGRFVEFLLKNNCIIDAVDLEEKHVQFMKERFGQEKNLKIHLQDATKYVKQSESKYDIVIISGLLLFFDDEETLNFLSNVNQILEKNGKIIVRDFICNNNNQKFKSSIFKDTYLFYRTLNFYQANFNAKDFQIARFNHRFPKIESNLFEKLGYRFYKNLFSIKYIRELSWIRSKTTNMMFVIEKNK